ncbi:MAG: sugar ABC transporter permease [Spirochaetaceae bacterium]|jgi:N-acetylglucosamine transport system permease protein|nr:sugar ABC transporter permease [Spirochaetaceae bacterium]
MRKKNPNRPPLGFLAACVVPALVLTLVLMVFPAFNALRMSFTNAASIRASSNARFVGLDNYIYMFVKDIKFHAALWNTFRLILVVPVCTIFAGLVCAFFLTQTKLRERGVYRVLFFFPSVISFTVVAVVWACIFDPRSGGVANKILGILGAGPVIWLGDDRYALWCIAFVLIWQAAGYYMVMHIAAIDGISTDIYEAASIDGAGPAAKFFRITIPLLKDTIGITLVLSLSGTINISYILSQVMTGGGPGSATLVILQYVYLSAFGSSANFGYAMSVTVFSLALAFLLSFLSRKVSYTGANT